MPFTLNIDFVGLCLWAEDRTPPEADGPRLHVLLLAPDLEPGAAAPHPGGGHAGHDATHRHHPRLFYDTAYNRAGAKQLTDRFSSVSLEDKALDLSAIRGDLDASLPGLPNISDLAGAMVPRKRVGVSPGDLISARVTFASGEGTPVIAEAPWDLGPFKGISIAHKMRWTLRVEAERLEWEFLGLNGLGGQPLVPLHPVNKTIDLRIANVPREDLAAKDPEGEKPEPGHVMAHFLPFYAALANPKDRPVPVWTGKPTGGGGPIGGNFNCGGTRALVG